VNNGLHIVRHLWVIGNNDIQFRAGPGRIIPHFDPRRLAHIVIRQVIKQLADTFYGIFIAIAGKMGISAF